MCKDSKIGQRKCVLYNGNHPANYKGCTIYKDLQNKAFPQLLQRKKDAVNKLDKQQHGSYTDPLRSDQSLNKPITFQSSSQS